MGLLLEKLKVYGYSRDEEAIILSALLTGEPILLIGDVGSAKTTLIRKLGHCLYEARGYRCAIYNLALDSFDDLIGFVDLKKLKDGKADYVHTPATIWDKEIVGADEANRPKASQASKWLDYFQDRKMMGTDTAGMFLFGAMNPLSVQGTNPMGEAQLGRFASFVWVPELTSMSRAERRAVLRCTTTSTLPGMKAWNRSKKQIGDQVDYETISKHLIMIMEQAADHYEHLMGKSSPVESFLDEFIMAVFDSTKAAEEPVKVDGRRGGMLFRHIVAIRSIELARANVLGVNPKSLTDCVRTAVRSGLPIGVNSETGKDEETMVKINEAMDAVLPFLDEDTDHRILELHTELLSGTDPFRKLEILLTEPIHDVVKTSAWQSFTTMRHFNGFIIGYVCLQIEAMKPGTVPESAIDGLVRLMDSGPPVVRNYALTPDLEPFREEIQTCLDQPTLWGQLIAGHAVGEFLQALPSKPEESKIRSELDKVHRKTSDIVRQTNRVQELIEEIAEEARDDGTSTAGRGRKKARRPKRKADKASSPIGQKLA